MQTINNNNRQITDPVCGMQLDPDKAAARECHDGIAYHFCAERCRKAFTDNPQHFISKKKKGIWRRYLDRLGKATGGQPMSCH